MNSTGRRTDGTSFDACKSYVLSNRRRWAAEPAILM